MQSPARCPLPFLRPVALGHGMARTNRGIPREDLHARLAHWLSHVVGFSLLTRRRAQCFGVVQPAQLPNRLVHTVVECVRTWLGRGRQRRANSWIRYLHDSISVGIPTSNGPHLEKETEMEAATAPLVSRPRMCLRFTPKSVSSAAASRPSVPDLLRCLLLDRFLSGLTDRSKVSAVCGEQRRGGRGEAR